MSGKDDEAEVGALISGAAADGVLSPASVGVISGHLGSVVVAGAAGKALEDIMASDVTLVTVLLDASSSIADRGLAQAVRDGHAALLEAFAKSREKDSVLLALWTFASAMDVVHSYLPVSDATRLDAKNYRPSGATALYDTWCDALAANVAYAQRLRAGGTPCKSLVVVVTDGEDVGSKRSAGDCARLSSDVLASETFTLAFVGVGPGADFHRVARAMGVPAGDVLVQKDATPTALRQVFHLVSQSALKVSQGKIAPGAGGFFAP